MRPLCNAPRYRKDVLGKENMSKNVVGLASTINQVDRRVNVQTPFRRLNCRTIQCNNEKIIKPDVTNNEDFSFEKLRFTVEEFEKQQQDRLLERSTTKKQLSDSKLIKYERTKPDVKDIDSTNNGAHTKVGCETLMRDINQNKEISIKKQLVKHISGMEIGGNKLYDVKLKARLPPDLCITSNTTKRCYTRFCEKNERYHDNSAQSLSSFQTSKAYSESKALMSQRRPMPEGDRITADGDIVSLSSESSPRSPRNMLVVCHDEVDSLENNRNSTTNSSTSPRHDSQPKRKLNRLPTDSENDDICLTVPRFINENNMVVTTNHPQSVHSPYTRRNGQAKRLSKHSPQIKGRSFNPSLYKFTPRIKKEEVEATDNKNASVQKISQWLGNDPFGNRKQRVLVRQGSEIMVKSRLFEHDDVVQMREKEVASEKELQHFPAGKVSQGKKWLQTAFVEEKEDDGRNTGLKKKSQIVSRCERKK